MRPIVIFGAGGFAREVHQLINDINSQTTTWRFLGFLDDDVRKHGAALHGSTVLGGLEWLRSCPEAHVVIGLGDPASKRRVAGRLRDLGHGRFATLVHPKASVGSHVDLGEGCIVSPGATITTDIVVEPHSLVYLNVSVGHDSRIGAFATLSPGVNVSGNVAIGEGCLLGTNSAVIQGVRIGAWTTVGAGAVVVDDLPANVTAVGVPARTIKQHAAGWHEK